jgi:hypothetical protein
MNPRLTLIVLTISAALILTGLILRAIDAAMTAKADAQ